MGMHRTHRRHMERVDAIETMAKNRVFKTRERKRRTDRMLATVKAGKLPYAPTVMSWLSRELEKPAKKITPEDVKTLVT
ncbi:MAG: hypothetical protein Q7R41_20180 [Phycisphaerales bacterium]|nr:hypothetical protein [Phycisphaerales bacterium]